MPRPEANVEQHLRVQANPGQQIGQRLAAAHTGLKHLQGADQAIAGGVLVQRQQMAGALAAEDPAALVQLLQHIAVAHLGPHEPNVSRHQRDLNRLVGHQGADTARHVLISRDPIRHHQVQQLVAIEETPGRVDDLQPVRIAVQRDPVVGLVRAHGVYQRLRMGGAHLVVDVQPIG